MKYLVSIGLALFMLGFALGVPLFAWGITDWQGFFSNPARVLYGVSIGLWALAVGGVLLLLRFPYTPGKRKGDRSKRVSRQSIVPILTRLVWLAVFVISPYDDRRGIAMIIGAGYHSLWRRTVVYSGTGVGRVGFLGPGQTAQRRGNHSIRPPTDYQRAISMDPAPNVSNLIIRFVMAFSRKLDR